MFQVLTQESIGTIGEVVTLLWPIVKAALIGGALAYCVSRCMR